VLQVQVLQVQVLQVRVLEVRVLCKCRETHTTAPAVPGTRTRARPH